jgi:hypothetical protein
LLRLVRFVSVFTVPLVLASTLPLSACDDDGAGSSSSPDSGAATPAPTGDGTTSTFGDSGTTPKADAKHGLCGEMIECTLEPEDTCAPPPDASAPPAVTLGCRVTTVNGETSTHCKAADPRGVDGTACAQSSDCAPGFDCVEGDKGAICRRYCCSGSCESQMSRNGGSTFCDVGKVASLDPHMIPVCMPVKACKLLQAADCGDKETCAIVTDDGVTSCVPRGDAKVGDPCDETHCDANLTCLGNPGDRHCYKLCRVDGNDCGPMETCTTGSVFQDTSFGVCKKD